MASVQFLILSKISLMQKKRDEIGVGDAENFIDAYTAEMTKKTTRGMTTNMDDEHLVKVINELFAVGTETISTTIYWCILYILNNPAVQKKLHSEIEDVVGIARSPNMQDMPKLTYLNAFIMETQRLASIVPLSVTHMCSEETILRGYKVPKGSFIVPNIDSVLHNKDIWGGDVMDFKPERFIDDNGRLTNPEELIPFGIGRRICLGESMARMELFLFLSSMFQKFEFLRLDPKCPPSIEPVFSMVTSPSPYEVRVIERKTI